MSKCTIVNLTAVTIIVVIIVPNNRIEERAPGEGSESGFSV